MKKCLSFLIVAVFLFKSVDVAAQVNEENYKKQAEAVRNEVWGWKIKEFSERNVPDQYAKYSKIILAKHEEITGLTKSKIKWTGLGIASQRDLTYAHTTRELIKINDQSALDDYSEISFRKFAQSYKDKFTTYLGVRIIKPDGSMKEVNPDEMVLTDDSKKNKEGKLAIPDLQIGDIIDYFIQTVEFYDGGSYLSFENFVFADENPILHYSVHVEASSKLAIEYRPMNGAPDFKQSTDDDDNNILDASQNNIPPFPLDLWMSPYRQIPILRFHMRMGAKGNASNTRKQGEVYKNLPSEEIVTDYDNMLSGYVLQSRVAANAYKNKIKEYAESYLEKHGGGKIKDNSLSIYYALRHYVYYKPNNETVSAVDQRKNYGSPDAALFLAVMEAICADYDINAQFILLPSKYGPKANEVMSASDFEPALLTEDNHIYTAESIFDVPDVIPYFLEGQQGTTLDYSMKMRGPKAEKGSYSAKYSPASANTHQEDLVYTFNPADPQKLKVNRKVTLTGLMCLDTQKKLLLYEDYYEEERNEMGIKDNFTDELKDSKKGKKIVDEYQNAFAEARKAWKDDFEDDINDQYDVKPEDVANYKIIQSGLFDKKSAMIYSVDYNVSAWIKKAGNNFILEAGKMVGPQLKVKPEQRDRNADIYMPNARTFQYNLQIAIPQGYTAEGVDKLNTSIDNATGSFITTAKVENGILKITTTKIYKNAFEKADKWQDLLKIIDAANAFEDAKIMFKKS